MQCASLIVWKIVLTINSCHGNVSASKLDERQKGKEEGSEVEGEWGNKHKCLVNTSANVIGDKEDDDDEEEEKEEVEEVVAN